MGFKKNALEVLTRILLNLQTTLPSTDKSVTSYEQENRELAWGWLKEQEAFTWVQGPKDCESSSATSPRQ